MTGNYNTADGAEALYSNTTGENNTASGSFALWLNTTGSDNAASGYGALYSNVAGSNNTASGWNALYSNTNGASNTAPGEHLALCKYHRLTQYSDPKGRRRHRRMNSRDHCERRAASIAAASRHMPARIAAGLHEPNPSTSAFAFSPPP
jgi:hypothetical protein